MIEALENFENKGVYVAIFISIFFIFISGLFFGLVYFVMDTTNTSLLVNDCVIDNNTLVSSCQDLFSLGVYPFLALRSILIWASFFFIFGLVIAMLVLGYRSGSSAVTLGIMVTFVGGLTYLGVLLSNVYRDLIGQAVFRSMMTPFTVYNNIMINFPWFVFFVGLFSVILGIVNFQKSSINTPEGELNY